MHIHLYFAPSVHRAGDERVARAQPQVDRHDVGDVEADDRIETTAKNATGSAGAADVPQRRQRDDRREHADADHGGHGHVALVDRAPQPPARNRPVARERVERARAARHAGHAAEELPDRGDQDHGLRGARAHRALEDRERAPPAAGLRVGRRERDREQDEPADDRGVEDRLPDAARRRHLGVVRLLGHVRRRVVAGDRVHRQQEAERQHVVPEHRHAEPGVVDASVKTKSRLWCRSGTNDEDRDDHRDARDVPEHADVVEQRDEVRAVDVDQRVERP